MVTDKERLLAMQLLQQQIYQYEQSVPKFEPADPNNVTEQELLQAFQVLVKYIKRCMETEKVRAGSRGENIAVGNINAVLNEIESYTLDRFINGYGEAGVPTGYNQIISQIYDNPLATVVCRRISALKEIYYKMHSENSDDWDVVIG